MCALVVAITPQAPTSEGPRSTVLRCTECAAALAFSPDVQAPRCAFCGAVTRVEHPTDPLERAEYVVPFGTERSDAEAALAAWLARRGWLHPRDLASAATVATLEPLHWASWVVDARALVSWAADSNADAGRASWAPHAGQTTMDFGGIVVPASRGLTWSECAQLTPHYQLGVATPVGASPAGTIEAFDAQRSAARKTVLAAIEATAAARLERGIIPGTRFRKVKVGVLLQGLTTRRVALPAWVLAYRYRGRSYRAIIHGQRADVLLGRAPYSRITIGLLVAGAVALVVTALALVAR